MERRENLVGVYGGTFDPIHLGHIHLLQSLLKTGLFKKILLVPAKQNPLKPQPSQIPDSVRLEMLKASLQELAEPKVEIWEGELNRPGLSYMKDTLKELSQSTKEELVLILGNEVFRELPKWKDPKTVLSLAHIALVVRDDKPSDIKSTLEQCGIHDASSTESWSKDTEVGGVTYLKSSRWTQPFNINALPYSSTQIRQNLANAWKTKEFMSPPQGIQRSVWLLIKENQLYAVN